LSFKKKLICPSNNVLDSGSLGLAEGLMEIKIEVAILHSTKAVI